LKHTPFKKKRKAGKPINKVSKSPKKKIEKEADGLWSEYILLRDGEWCMKCKSRKANQAHHIFTRSIKSLRHDPENGIALCSYCHTLDSYGSAHKSPEAFREFLLSHMGEARYFRLYTRSQMIKQPYDPKMSVIGLRAMLDELEN